MCICFVGFTFLILLSFFCCFCGIFFIINDLVYFIDWNIITLNGSSVIITLNGSSVIITLNGSSVIMTFLFD